MIDGPQDVSTIERRDLPRGDSLFPLNGGRTGHPVFFIQPVSGTSWLFQPLVDALDMSRPIYGTRTPELDWRRDVLTMRELAVHYATEIRKVQRSGPYSLLGYSFGGLLAFEIALRLEAGGDEVEHLVLLDVPGPQPRHRRWLRRARRVKRAALRLLIRRGLIAVTALERLGYRSPMAAAHLCFDTQPLREADVSLLLRMRFPDYALGRDLDAMTLDELCRAFVDLARPEVPAAEWDVITRGCDPADAVGQMKGATLTVKNFCLAGNFRPSGTFNGRMTIFRTPKNAAVLRWRRVVSQPIALIDIDVAAIRARRAHSAFLAGDNVGLFANELRAVFEGAQEVGAGAAAALARH